MWNQALRDRLQLVAIIGVILLLAPALGGQDCVLADPDGIQESDGAPPPTDGEGEDTYCGPESWPPSDAFLGPSAEAGDGEPVPGATTEALGLIGATAWHNAGYSGAGVKIGIVASGFSGYATLLGSELPATVTTHWSDSLSAPGSSALGTAVAEVVHDVAPGAALYFANFGSGEALNEEWEGAVDWIISQDVQILLLTGNFVGTESQPRDDTNLYCVKVTEAHTAGALICQPAGDCALEHWSGTFNDPDENGWLSFSGDDEYNVFPASAGDMIRLTLTWDDTWGGSSNDYDLYLYDDTVTPIASSQNRQDGNDDPYEIRWVPAPYTGLYGIRIQSHNSDETGSFHLFSFGHELEHQVSDGSVLTPGDSASALTASSVPWDSPDSVPPMRSRGPTDDGRIKPDLVGPEAVSTSFGTFYGTTCGTAHVAGAAALVLEAYPACGPDDVQTYLETNAVDLGDPGKDNEFGSGRLLLPGGTHDFGDAPDPTYPTLLASNGARHTVVPGFYLGSDVDVEFDGQPNTAATGDDMDSDGDDEDGVVFTSPLVAGESATVDVYASASGYLDAWIDFNDDGDWDDTGEQIFASQALVAGCNSLSFSVPGDMPGEVEYTYCRFRFSSVGGLGYTGEADDGEVEDYRRPAEGVNVEIPLQVGWNMVSVPVVAGDMSTASVFPGADAVYTWNPTTKSYTIPSQVDPEKAYWVAVSSAAILNVLGVPVENWTQDIKTGWNMTGSLYGCTPSIADPDDTPDGSVEGFAYTWDPLTKSYVYGTEIEPGKGYWVAATADCTLALAPPP